MTYTPIPVLNSGDAIFSDNITVNDSVISTSGDFIDLSVDYLKFSDSTTQITAYTGQEITLSGVLQPQITQNANDIIAVSGIAGGGGGGATPTDTIHPFLLGGM